ncbi:MAG: hypothetical protein CME70_04605 [Halobacteriovorax sp.]|nr:hypothetical protein [Halobacteriovorax sp.]|tara:strand:+ start:81849 stop:82646 length:798 start_codon:yes stop_codon:yes gene_type:complete
MNFKALLLTSTLVFLASCGQRMSTIRTPRALSQIELLKNSPVYILEKEIGEMGTETRSLKLPTTGEKYSYKATYFGDKKLQFEKEDDGTKYLCIFSYSAAEISEEVTEVNDKAYKLKITVKPSEAKYIGEPFSEREKSCLEDLKEGKYSYEKPILLSDQLKKFKRVIKEHFVDQFNKCDKRFRPDFYTCKVESITLEAKTGTIVDYMEMIFIGTLVGKPIQLRADINFDRIYFSNFGILRMDLIGLSTSIELLKLKSISPINWKL